MEASDELVLSERAESSDTIDGNRPPDPVPLPPAVPASGISILAHKIWIGNLDRRLTEYVITVRVDSGALSALGNSAPL